jgi:hypothetical protein
MAGTPGQHSTFFGKQNFVISAHENGALFFTAMMLHDYCCS